MHLRAGISLKKPKKVDGNSEKEKMSIETFSQVVFFKFT